MIELIQFPWSSFCQVQRRLLEFSGKPFQTINIPSNDRSLVWKLTRQRYYGVPVIRDGRTVVFETSETSQVIGKYLDDMGWSVSARWTAYRRPGITSKNETAPSAWPTCTGEFAAGETVDFLRFGTQVCRRLPRQWQRTEHSSGAAAKTPALREMLMHHRFLPAARFVDFDLFGMLTHYLTAGRGRLPNRHTRLRHWLTRMQRVKASQFVP